MSRPRSIVAGRTYLVSRRCAQRQFLLRPCPEVNNLFWYCLANASNATGVHVIAALMMSNHYHLVVTDVDGCMPEFLQRFHSLFARSLNCFRGRWENVWAAHEQTSLVELVTPEDVLAKTVYTLCNPVAADLVETTSDWPGASSWMHRREGRIVAKRPDFFFAPQDHAAVCELTLHDPEPALLEKSGDGSTFQSTIKKHIKHREDELRAARRAAPAKTVLGKARVLRQRWDAKPTTHEPRRRMSPRVACYSKWHRIETLQRNRKWLDAYAVALATWREHGIAEFPEGTWMMARVLKVAPAPS